MGPVKPGDFLRNASQLYMDTCPGISRHLMRCHVKTKEAERGPGTVCPTCHQWLQPDNQRVRLRPKRRPSPRLQLILRRNAAGKRLSAAETKLLRRFLASSSTMMATCHACNTTSRHKGVNRDFIASLAKTHSGTPGKHNKTPQSASRSNTSTPKTPGKSKTPSNTPRGSTSSTTSGSSSSSSKTPKAKNWVVQRLSKILMRDDSPAVKKGGLKDFLSSL